MDNNARMIVYIPETGWVKGKGHRVAIVVENESGYYPSGGGDKAPWYWGNGEDCAKSLKEAKEMARSYNERMGISESEALKILCSSMRKSMSKSLG